MQQPNNNILKTIVASQSFEWLTNLVIITNCLLIGSETYFTTPIISFVQHGCLLFFVFEIILRFLARESTQSFFQSKWNIFDLSLVFISLAPPQILPHASLVMVLRVLRVFRVLRLFKTCRELKLIIDVLTRSISALAVNAIFYFIFLYLFAIIGVECFRLPSREQTPPDAQEKLQQYLVDFANAPPNSPDPYGSLHDSMFSLFRIMTGEDWTDIYYNLIEASKLKLIPVPCWFVSFYHISWYCLSAFLLLNLIVGAVVNNYQVIMDEMKKKNEYPF